MTKFGYDTSAVHLAAATSQNSIFGHVENLLVDLKNERRTANAGTKPLIFVGHSLGGLVIKQVRLDRIPKCVAALIHEVRL